MEPREILLFASREILAQAVDYHDRAMDIFDELDPAEDALALGIVGSSIDLGLGVDLPENEACSEQIADEPIAEEPKSRQRQKSPAMTLREIRQLAGDDEPTLWVPMVRRALAGGELVFDDLVRVTGLRRVQVWMACLLGGFELVPGADFYGADLVVRLQVDAPLKFKFWTPQESQSL